MNIETNVDKACLTIKFISQGLYYSDCIATMDYYGDKTLDDVMLGVLHENTLFSVTGEYSFDKSIFYITTINETINIEWVTQKDLEKLIIIN